MIASLEEFGRLFAAMWYAVNRWMQWALYFVIAWPFAMIIIATVLPPSMAVVVVPVVAILPVVALLFLAIGCVNLLTVGIVAFVPPVRRALIWIPATVGLELLAGVYFSAVPVSNDRGLVPLLVLAMLAIAFLRMGGIVGWPINSLVILIVILTLVFFFGGREKIKESGKKTVSDYRATPIHPATRAPSPRVKPLTRINVQNADPHVCDKPAEAYYYHSHFAPNERNGEQEGYHDPRFLFDVRHETNTVSWANGFRGTVPVCFVVDEKGEPADINFPQPPDNELGGHIKEGIASMRYSPGTYDRKPVRVQMSYNLVFP